MSLHSNACCYKSIVWKSPGNWFHKKKPTKEINVLPVFMFMLMFSCSTIASMLLLFPISSLQTAQSSCHSERGSSICFFVMHFEFGSWIVWKLKSKQDHRAIATGPASSAMSDTLLHQLLAFSAWQLNSSVSQEKRKANKWINKHFVKILFLIFSCPEQLNRWPCHSLTHSLTNSRYFTDWHTKSNPRSLWPLRHLIR